MIVLKVFLKDVKIYLTNNAILYVVVNKTLYI